MEKGMSRKKISLKTKSKKHTKNVFDICCFVTVSSTWLDPRHYPSLGLMRAQRTDLRVCIHKFSINNNKSFINFIKCVHA